MEKLLLYENGPERLIYIPSYFDPAYFDQLKKQVPWTQKEISMFGKTHPEPRLTCWFGPFYNYSGIRLDPLPFPPFVEEMRKRLATDLDFSFNSVLLNYYRHASDYMGWHRDNEKQMDGSLIASVSFGGERKFSFKHRNTKERMDIVLENGSLLLMYHLQQNWQHSLPKSPRNQNERINLTFRRIIEE